eukprot:3714667-Pyramimonas_sp.AAC.1
MSCDSEAAACVALGPRQSHPMPITLDSPWFRRAVLEHEMSFSKPAARIRGLGCERRERFCPSHFWSPPTKLHLMITP